MKVRLFLIIFFSFVNTAAFFFYTNGYINSVHVRGEFNSPLSYYVITLSTLLLSLYLILKVFTFFESNIKTKSFKFNLEKNRYTLLGLFIILVQFIYLFVFFTQSSYRAGGVDDLGGGLFGVVYALLQIQFLPVLYIVSIPREKRNIIWWIILFQYITTYIAQGWSGIFLILGILYLSDMEIKGKRFSVSGILRFISILIIIFYPFIYYGRSYMRGRFISDFEIIDFLLHTYNMLLERLEQFHLSLGSFIYRNEIAEAYNNNLIIPYYKDGIVQSLVGGDGVGMGDFVVSLFYNLELGTYLWNVSPGFVSLFYTNSISIFFIIPYYMFLIFIIVLCLKLIKANFLAYNLTFLFLIIFLWPGWFSMFFWYVWAVVLFTFLVQFFMLLENLFIKNFRKLR